ncbi:MAG: 6-phosphofructokinase [Clostridiales bacterium]|jgi:6-phosphofructokinase 1|nr:6-phosphofructokinase [Clostridiales bacterium]
MKENFLVGQSGGPSPVINASLYGIIDEAQKTGSAVYGMINGIEGFLDGHFMDTAELYRSPSFRMLPNTPSSYLGSCRYKLPKDLNSEVYRKVFNRFDELKIGTFIYIGGNDSMDTVNKLNCYARASGIDIKIIGVPKTIDNDLMLTDHTPGFGSAAKYVACSMRELTLDVDAYFKPSIVIVEVMGRHAGWLTAAASLAPKYADDNPCLIYLPELTFSVEKFLDDINTKLKEKTSVIVAISEGIRLANGRLLCEDENTAVDAFGHKSLSGSAKILERISKDKFAVKCRAIELSLLQRSSAVHASGVDVEEAVLAGRFGVQKALDGNSGKMVAFQRKKGAKYEIECALEDVGVICNMEKTIPHDWIIKDGTFVSKEYADYAAPLLEGEPSLVYEHGLPMFCYRDRR